MIALKRKMLRRFRIRSTHSPGESTSIAVSGAVSPLAQFQGERCDFTRLDRECAFAVFQDRHCKENDERPGGVRHSIGQAISERSTNNI